MCGEFVGTVLFLWFALSGAQVANSVPSSAGLTVEQTGSNPQQLQYIALSFGFSLAVNAWVFFRISGGLFNPAVTFGMCLIGALPWVRGALLFVSQILGGIVASALVQCMFPGGLNVQTSLGGGTSVVQGLFIEMFLTAQLVFTIFMLAAEKHKGTFIAPVGEFSPFLGGFDTRTTTYILAGIGLSLFIAELTGVYFTGGSLNPARSFGPAVVNTSFHHYHWIYWIGPVLGSIVAAGFYKFIKILEYETANPDQDTDHAAKVERKKNLLIAAGINPVDANQVAHELQQAQTQAQAPSTADSEKTIVDGRVSHGGPDGKIVANGQGRSSFDGAHNEAMYGTAFAGGSTSSGHDRNILADRPGGPGLVGRYSYLGRAGRQPLASNLADRTDSPAIASHNEVFAAINEPDEALGGMVAEEPRNRFARTASSGV
jgi:aquaporin related protein